ncbi:hypothetical protein ACOMHN_038782 [Nucella lapillus]
MVDFRGFKHSDVPEGARGGVNKYRGVQKSKKKFITLRAGPAARGCPFTRPAVDRFFYSLNIPKMVDFRGFKHPDVPEGGRGGGNKHRGVKKSYKKHFSHRGAYLKRVTATPAVDPPWRPFFLQPQKVVLNTQPAAAVLFLQPQSWSLRERKKEREKRGPTEEVVSVLCADKSPGPRLSLNRSQ